MTFRMGQVTGPGTVQTDAAALQADHAQQTVIQGGIWTLRDHEDRGSHTGLGLDIIGTRLGNSGAITVVVILTGRLVIDAIDNRPGIDIFICVGIDDIEAVAAVIGEGAPLLAIGQITELIDPHALFRGGRSDPDMTEHNRVVVNGVRPVIADLECNPAIPDRIPVTLEAHFIDLVFGGNRKRCFCVQFIGIGDHCRNPDVAGYGTVGVEADRDRCAVDERNAVPVYRTGFQTDTFTAGINGDFVITEGRGYIAFSDFGSPAGLIAGSVVRFCRILLYLVREREGCRLDHFRGRGRFRGDDNRLRCLGRLRCGLRLSGPAGDSDNTYHKKSSEQNKRCHKKFFSYFTFLRFFHKKYYTRFM